MGYKRDVKENTRRLLYAKSGNMCAMYGCTNALVHANTANISEICHIEAVNESGARYNDNLSDEYVNSYENLILLCPTCHNIIDNKLNENLYTVEYVKRMKEVHEQRVHETLMNNVIIDAPLYLESYDVSRVVCIYNNFYGDQINDSYVYQTLEKILALNIAIRSIVYGIAMLCIEEETENVDIHRLHKMTNLDIYNYAEILMLLEQQKLVEEVQYVNPLDGYETENGDWHLVQNDYLYKTTQGTWYLQNCGKIFCVILKVLNNKQDFYELVVNRNLEMLRKL